MTVPPGKGLRAPPSARRTNAHGRHGRPDGRYPSSRFVCFSSKSPVKVFSVTRVTYIHTSNGLFFFEAMKRFTHLCHGLQRGIPTRNCKQRSPRLQLTAQTQKLRAVRPVKFCSVTQSTPQKSSTSPLTRPRNAIFQQTRHFFHIDNRSQVDCAPFMPQEEQSIQKSLSQEPFLQVYPSMCPCLEHIVPILRVTRVSPEARGTKRTFSFVPSSTTSSTSFLPSPSRSVTSGNGTGTWPACSFGSSTSEKCSDNILHQGSRAPRLGSLDKIGSEEEENAAKCKYPPCGAL